MKESHCAMIGKDNPRKASASKGYPKAKPSSSSKGPIKKDPKKQS